MSHQDSDTILPKLVYQLSYLARGHHGPQELGLGVREKLEIRFNSVNLQLALELSLATYN